MQRTVSVSLCPICRPLQERAAGGFAVGAARQARRSRSRCGQCRADSRETIDADHRLMIYWLSTDTYCAAVTDTNFSCDAISYLTHQSLTDAYNAHT